MQQQQQQAKHFLEHVTMIPSPFAGRYNTAAQRLQAHPHAARSLFDELFMPLEERTQNITNALNTTSPGFYSLSFSLFASQIMLDQVVSPITAGIKNVLQRSLTLRAIITTLLHPWQARFVNLIASTPPEARIGVAFPRGVWQTLSEEKFYLRSLEPALLSALARTFIAQKRFVERAVAHLWPDPDMADTWRKIDDTLLEQSMTEPGSVLEEQAQNRLRGLYATRFHKWFMKAITRSLLEDYACRALLFPLETVAVRLNCSSVADPDLSPFFVVNATKIIRQEGITGLYSGFSVMLSAAFPHLAFAWALYFGTRLIIALVDPMTLANLNGFAPKTAAEKLAEQEEEDQESKNAQQ